MTFNSSGEIDIDSYLNKEGKVSILIPSDIRSINPSFLEEFLQNVVLKLGETAFYAKFTFDNPGPYKIDNDLKEAVERILREENVGLTCSYSRLKLLSLILQNRNGCKLLLRLRRDCKINYANLFIDNTHV